MSVGKIAGLPYTFMFRCVFACVAAFGVVLPPTHSPLNTPNPTQPQPNSKCTIIPEGCWQANAMLAVGTLPAHANANASLQWSEVYSFTRGEGCGEPRLDLGTFLPLRARVRERFPATAQLSDMQLLMLLTAPTLPWPLALNDTGVYGTPGDRYSEYSGAHLPTLATRSATWRACPATHRRLRTRRSSSPSATPAASTSCAGRACPRGWRSHPCSSPRSCHARQERSTGRGASGRRRLKHSLGGRPWCARFSTIG